MNRNFLKKTALWFLVISTTIMSCKKTDEVATPTTSTTPDLTKLPFGGKGSTKILLRNKGNASPDFLSLWLCGLPTDGAGANNAVDWTNPDGTWDYTKKPQVEGNVIWVSEFKVTLDGKGNRVLTLQRRGGRSQNRVHR